MQNNIQEAVDFALSNGLIKYNKHLELTHAPFALTPFPVSEALHQELIDLTPVFNRLWTKIANDGEFLRSALEKTAMTDHFISELLKLMPDGRPASPFQLLISRNDFLLSERPDSEDLVPKQVEFNTISNSFPVLSRQVSLLHRFLFHRGMLPCLPLSNDPLEHVVDAMAKAINTYQYQDSVMLMVVQEIEQNIFDQRAIEYRLLEKYQIQTIRMTLEEIAEKARLKEGHLVVDGQIAALTYFRAGYTPEDYPDPSTWKARELIEAASSIKCPTIAMQLAGAKKIQQLLGDRSTLEKFVDRTSADRIRETFVGLYTLDDTIDGISAAEAAGRSPDDYVLKPQREGGGNNLYGQEMVGKLASMGAEEQQAYILMEKIRAVTNPAELVVESVCEELLSISEVGRYGICFAQGEKIIDNHDAGYLVRTKAANIDEGGVCAGYACLNNLYMEK